MSGALSFCAIAAELGGGSCVCAGLRGLASCRVALRLCGRASRLRCWFLFDEARRWAVLFFHLLCQNNSAAETCELPKLVLD